MKTMLIAVLMLCATAASAATDANWTQVASASNGQTWDYQDHSGHLVTLTNSDIAYAANFRTIFPDGSTYYSQEYVRVSACQRGYGKEATTDMDGNPAGQIDFNLTGTTVGDTIAKELCRAWWLSTHPQPAQPPGPHVPGIKQST